MAEGTSFVGTNVRRVRERKGWTLAALSGRLAELSLTIHVSGLSNIETGARRVTVEELLALAFALDVSPVTLVLGEDDGHLVVAPGVELQGLGAHWWFIGLGPPETAWNDDGDRKVTVDGRVISPGEAADLRRWFDENRPYVDRRVDRTPGARAIVETAHHYAEAVAVLHELDGSGTKGEAALRDAVAKYLRWMAAATQEQAERFGIDLNA